MMRIALTGHLGLIGSALKKRLLKEGHDIVLEMDNRAGLPIDALENIVDMKGMIDVFIHTADFCRINRCVKYPALGHINAVNAYRVMEFCRKNNVPKIIHFSSSRVLSPEKNPYTAGKQYGEELCKAYHDCYGIDYLIIRPSTVYSPFDDKTGRLIDIYFRNAFANRDLVIYGDPKSKTLDFTYIDDFIDAVMLTIKDEWNTDYNVSGGEEALIYDLAKMIISVTGSKSNIVSKPAESAQPQKVKVNITKLKKMGYSPKINLHEGILKCADFYKKLLIK